MAARLNERTSQILSLLSVCLPAWLTGAEQTQGESQGDFSLEVNIFHKPWMKVELFIFKCLLKVCRFFVFNESALIYSFNV